MTPQGVKIQIRSNPRRPYFQVIADCGNSAVEDVALSAIQRAGVPPEGVVDLRLKGTINLSRAGFDPETLGRKLQELAGVTAVAVDVSAINLDNFQQAANTATAQLTRPELERESLRQLLAQEDIWEIDPEIVAELFFSLKEDVRLGRAPEDIASRILTAPIVEQVKMRLEVRG